MIPWYQNLPLWVTAIPILGALVLLFVPKSQRRVFELGALAVTVADFLVSVPLWFRSQTGAPRPCSGSPRWTGSPAWA